MPALEHGGDARRAHHRVQVGQSRQRFHRARRPRALEDGLHGLPYRPGLGGRHALEEAARHLVELHREVELRQPGEARRQVVDGVVLHGQGAVAAGVLRLEREILVDLLAGLHAVVDVLAVLDRPPAALVQPVLGVDQLTVVGDEPLHAVEVASLLVGGQGDDDVAVGLEALLLEADQVGDPYRGHRLVVGGATAVVVAVLLEERERVDRPVLLACLDHVEVGEQQQRPARARAPQPRDEIALALVGPEHPDVALREAGRLQPGGHRLRGPGRAAHRIRRVDLDQLLEDVVGKLLLRIEALGAQGRSRRAHERSGEDGKGRGSHPYLKASSSAVAPSVLSSRYFTMTGV